MRISDWSSDVCSSDLKILPADLSVSNAARQLGVGRPALSNLLNGKAKLSRDMALKLERTFGADANMLIRRQAELEEQAEKAATEVRAARPEGARAEERRVGKGCVSTGKIGGWG